MSLHENYNVLFPPLAIKKICVNIIIYGKNMSSNSAGAMANDFILTNVCVLAFDRRHLPIV